MSKGYQIGCYKCKTIDFTDKRLCIVTKGYDRKYLCDKCVPNFIFRIFEYDMYYPCTLCHKFKQSTKSKHYYIRDDYLYCGFHYFQVKELAKQKYFIFGRQYQRYDGRTLKILKTMYDEKINITMVYYKYLDTGEHGKIE